LTHQTKTFTITDPRDLDGDPYEVAAKAVAQAEALTMLTQNAVKDAFVMARNAEMERQILATGEPDAAAFEQGPHGRKFEAAIQALTEVITDMHLETRAAGFNPKGKLDG
jgi:hypothetical protein